MAATTLSLLLLACLALSAFHAGNCLPSPLFTFDVALDIGDEFEMLMNGDPGRTGERSRRASGRGAALESSDCDTVRDLPSDIRDEVNLDAFYQKYTHAYGIPILSSDVALDDALKRACYLVRFLLADREDLRNSMFDRFGRVGVIGQSEQTTDIPEHSYLPDWWNDRARGLGGTPTRPVTTDGEENILCKDYTMDRWDEEDVLLHEFAHAIHLIGLDQADPTFNTRLMDIWNQAKADDLWTSTYAITNHREYWAEGVQSFFNVNTCRDFTDNIHNHVCTQAILEGYDPRLFDLILEVFPCNNTIVDRCENQANIDTRVLRMNCDVNATTAVSVTGDGSETTVTDTSSNVTDVTESRASTSLTNGGQLASLPFLVVVILLLSRVDL